MILRHLWKTKFQGKLNPAQQAWTRPLSAVLQKWHEGAPKDPVTKKIDSNFAARMKNVLKVIQSDPNSFIPYLSTLGVSGLGTCRDRPVTVFLDLELRIHARQTLLDIKEGKKSLQDMLDVAVKRLVYDETLATLTSATQHGNLDPIEAALKGLEVIHKDALLDIPALPYRLYGTNLSNAEVTEIVNNVVDVVKQRYRAPEVINEFLAREESPVPWKEAGGSSPSNETQMKIELLRKQEEELQEPEQGNQEFDFYVASAPYKQYLADRQKIMAERHQLESAGIHFDEAQNKWLVA